MKTCMKLVAIASLLAPISVVGVDARTSARSADAGSNAAVRTTQRRPGAGNVHTTATAEPIDHRVSPQRDGPALPPGGANAAGITGTAPESFAPTGPAAPLTRMPVRHPRVANASAGHSAENARSAPSHDRDLFDLEAQSADHDPTKGVLLFFFALAGLAVLSRGREEKFTIST